MEDDTWHETSEEFSPQLAEAVCRYLKRKYFLTTQTLERSLFFEWSPGKGRGNFNDIWQPLQATR